MNINYAGTRLEPREIATRILLFMIASNLHHAHHSLDAGQLNWQAQQHDSLDHSGKARFQDSQVSKAGQVV